MFSNTCMYRRYTRVIWENLSRFCDTWRNISKFAGKKVAENKVNFPLLAHFTKCVSSCYTKPLLLSTYNGD